jgi:signal transduction histidine kinase
MKSERLNFSQRYKEALLAHLKMNSQTSTVSAPDLLREALKSGLRSRAFSRLHEQIMVMDVLHTCPLEKREELLRQAGLFFAEIATSIDNSESKGRAFTVRLKKVVTALSVRTAELADAKSALSKENSRLKALEKTLKKSERHYEELLEKSKCLQEQLRQLSHQILTAQEDERKKISRELHDVIAQALTGINVRLATLKKEASQNTSGLERNIAKTQRVVMKSTNIVHQFARELRPASLDDLGLIPALHAFMKNFTTRTGIRTWLTAFAGVEKLDTNRRTVLFRVAQEALTNVARHARASRADVTIEKIGNDICMKIKDDGKSFQVQRVLQAKGGKCFGLVGMRERVEMVKGHFEINSGKGEGTTIIVKIPFVVAGHKQTQSTTQKIPIAIP